MKILLLVVCTFSLNVFGQILPGKPVAARIKPPQSIHKIHKIVLTDEHERFLEDCEYIAEMRPILALENMENAPYACLKNHIKTDLFLLKIPEKIPQIPQIPEEILQSLQIKDLSKKNSLYYLLKQIEEKALPNNAALDAVLGELKSLNEDQSFGIQTAFKQTREQASKLKEAITLRQTNPGCHQVMHENRTPGRNETYNSDGVDKKDQGKSRGSGANVQK